MTFPSPVLLSQKQSVANGPLGTGRTFCQFLFLHVCILSGLNLYSHSLWEFILVPVLFCVIFFNAVYLKFSTISPFYNLFIFLLHGSLSSESSNVTQISCLRLCSSKYFTSAHWLYVNFCVNHYLMREEESLVSIEIYNDIWV